MKTNEGRSCSKTVATKGQSTTPVIKQYMQVKENYKDCILFYRQGDFYEIFFEDAPVAARELGITLTARNYGLKEKVPMCGVPHHSRDYYIAKLTEKGYKVAVCEQTEEPGEANGIAKTEVTLIQKELLDHVAGKASEGVNKATKDMCDRLSDVIAYTGTYAENNGISFDEAIDILNQPEEKAIMHQELRERWKMEDMKC